MEVHEENEGLRAVVRRESGRVLEIPWRSEEILLNLNAPADLEPTVSRKELGIH